MKIYNKIIGAILIVLTTLLVIAIFLPSKQIVSSSISVNAPLNQVFKQVNNLRNWGNWSPFQEADSTLIITFEGAEAGVGAIQKWKSNNGDKGKLSIIESDKNTSINNQLVFHKNGQAEGNWEFSKNKGQTIVTWQIEFTDLSYPIGKFMGLFINRMMQPMIDKGLSNLKSYTEVNKNPHKIEQLVYRERSVITLRDSCLWPEIGVKTNEMLNKIMPFIHKKKIEVQGSPYSHYIVWDEEQQFTIFEVGVPISNESKNINTKDFSITSSPAGKSIKSVHHGTYEQIYKVYLAMDQYMEDYELEQSGGPWEVYISGPTTEKDTAKWLTEIYFPVKEQVK